MKNVKMKLNEETMNNEFNDGIEDERIEIVLLDETRVEKLCGFDKNGNEIAFFDEFAGENGEYVKNGNFDEFYEIASKNLMNHYHLEDFEFEKVSNSQVYKFDCFGFTGNAKSVMLLKNVQNAVINKVGPKPYFIVSGRGNLFVSSVKEDLNDIADAIVGFDKAWLESAFTFYTLDQNGKYNAEKVLIRENN